MNVIPIASSKIFLDPKGFAPFANQLLYTIWEKGGYEEIVLYKSNNIGGGSVFNPYSFSPVEFEVLPESVFDTGFWNSNSHPTCKGNPRLLNGIFNITGSTDKIALISGDVGTTVSKREVGVCKIQLKGNISAVTENSVIKCATGESILNGSVVYLNNFYNIFLVRKLSTGVTQIEHWKTQNLTTTPTLYKIIDKSSNHSSNNGSIYNGGFLDVTAFIFDSGFKLLVTGINNYLYSGLATQSTAEGNEQVTTVGWYDYNGMLATDGAIVPEFTPSYVGPVIVPFPLPYSIISASMQMLGVKGSPVIFSEGGKNYIILGFSGYKYINSTTFDNVKTTVWIYELKLL